jgi:hypothetical protein
MAMCLLSSATRTPSTGARRINSIFWGCGARVLQYACVGTQRNTKSCVWISRKGLFVVWNEAFHSKSGHVEYDACTVRKDMPAWQAGVLFQCEDNMCKLSGTMAKNWNEKWHPSMSKPSHCGFTSIDLKWRVWVTTSVGKFEECLARKQCERMGVAMLVITAHYLYTFVLHGWHRKAPISVHNEVLIGIIVKNLSLLGGEAQRIRQKVAVCVEKSRHDVGEASLLRQPCSNYASSVMWCLCIHNRHLEENVSLICRRSAIYFNQKRAMCECRLTQGRLQAGSLSSSPRWQLSGRRYSTVNGCSRRLELLTWAES